MVGQVERVAGQIQQLDCQRRRDVPSTTQTTPTTPLNNDVGAQLLVLRDVDESRQYPGVS